MYAPIGGTVGGGRPMAMNSGHPQPHAYPQAAHPPTQPPSYAQAQNLPQGYSAYTQGHTNGAIPFASTCTGRKKALFVGITYKGTSAALNGCVNDVKNLYGFVQRFYGFRREDCRVLTDDPTFTEALPTRQNILASMQWLVQGAQPGDSLFFHYSGHGGSVRDRNGDEADEMDETILPLDHDRRGGGQILDDEIHQIMVKPLLRGVRLTAVFDSCHSGSVMDLPFSYKVDGSLEIVQIDNTTAVVNSLATAGLALMAGNKTMAVLSGIEALGKMFAGPKNNEAARKKTEMQNMSEADVLQFGGCRDDQTSADARINGQASGAMSWAFITSLTQNPHQQYAELLKNMRQLMRGKYTQTPQISTGHKIDLFVPFNI